jgi:hypothetical protein
MPENKIMQPLRLEYRPASELSHMSKAEDRPSAYAKSILTG